jgi:peptide/nickel transport system ATP-binding protein
MARPGPLLEVENLRVIFADGDEERTIVDGLSLRIDAGEVVALVGESGSGKSVTALSLVRLLPPGLAIADGRIRLDGDDVVRMTPAQMDEVRGGRIAMLFQNPQAMLDPTCKVGRQVAEPLQLHRGLDRRAANDRAIELLRDVGISEPEVRARSYPHQFSGGMAQRAMIASALSADPELLIADEPTTALDVTVQAQILRLLDQLRRQRGLAILLITHDLSIVSAFAERVAVMYAGRIVEEGPTASILRTPKHPYTRALVECALLRPDDSGLLYSIPGSTSQVYDIDHGCRFHARCHTAASLGIGDRCHEAEPALCSSSDGCKVRCWAVVDTPSAGASHANPQQDRAGADAA